MRISRAVAALKEAKAGRKFEIDGNKVLSSDGKKFYLNGEPLSRKDALRVLTQGRENPPVINEPRRRDVDTQAPAPDTGKDGWEDVSKTDLSKAVLEYARYHEGEVIQLSDKKFK